jgi:carbonic anhydrase
MDLVYRCDRYAPVATRRIDDTEAAIQELDKGHRTYQRIVEHFRATFLSEDGHESLVLPFDPLTFGVAMVEGASVAQTPFAVVLGCSDARVPTEQIFHQDNNDIFVVRVAGNVLGIECLGSIDYAAGRMDSLKVIVVLGHTGCGAVTAAVDMYLGPTDYPDLGLSFPLRSLVDRIMVAVRGAAKAMERVCGPNCSHDQNYRATLIEVAVFLNAALTAFDVRHTLALDPSRGIEVVHGVFDIATQRVRSRIDAGSDDPLFAPAPTHAADLDEIATHLCKTMVARGAIDPAFCTKG